jgi:predicted AAA+ superfamily ATPase
MTDNALEALNAKLDRLIEAVARLAPASAPQTDLAVADCFVWQADPGYLEPVHKVNRVEIGLIRGVDRVRDILVDNTERFARGYAANNVLLWGTRGMGKSSLVKAVHAEINASGRQDLKLIEIHREDIDTLPRLMMRLKAAPYRFILFCDDLSFDRDETSYKSLKTILDGGLEGRPANVLFYATSNRRHLMPRDMIDNERATAINAGEAIDEKISLSDRFGLWLGFHNCDQETFLAMVRGYCDAYGLRIDDATLRARAIEWSATRGARSGRVAWQFIQDLAGRLGHKLEL